MRASEASTLLCACAFGVSGLQVGRQAGEEEGSKEALSAAAAAALAHESMVVCLSDYLFYLLFF